MIGRFSSCDPGRSQTGTATSRVDWSSSGCQDRPASSSLRPRSAQARLQAGKNTFSSVGKARARHHGGDLPSTETKARRGQAPQQQVVDLRFNNAPSGAFPVRLQSSRPAVCTPVTEHAANIWPDVH